MSKTLRLNPLDTAWLFTETRATPNHVGGLLTFRVPDGAPQDFLRRMTLEFREHRSFTAPWNRRLKFAVTKNPVPEWVETEDIDLEYHVRHAALPWPGGERELGELVGRLHSTPIDLTRPPWECTIIEGLADNRFALFIKMHHSLIDGVSGVRTLMRAFSNDATKSRSLPPFWSAQNQGDGGARRASSRSSRAAPSVAEVTAAAMETLGAQARSLPQLAVAFGRIIGRIGDPRDGLAVPFDAPRSVLNGRVREKRRFATQQFSMERMKAVAEAAGGTINDVVLSVCGGAMRRFLLERDALPDKPLTAGIPVSVRPSGEDSGSGNAISFIVATLGTDIEDPMERLQAIRSSVRHAKEHVQSLPRQAMMQYTMLLMAPTIFTLLSGLGGRTPPMFNCTISNVPGPEKALYFRGAELLNMYPASIVTHGQALNITCGSYNGQMNFGFTACHTSVPSVQRLAVYLADAMGELETAYGLAKARPTLKPKAQGRRAPASKGKPAERPRRKTSSARRSSASSA